MLFLCVKLWSVKQPTSLFGDEFHPCEMQLVWFGAAGNCRDSGDSWRDRIRPQRTWKSCPGTLELAQLCLLGPGKEISGSTGL